MTEELVHHPPFSQPVLADHLFDRGRQQVGLSFHLPAWGSARWGRIWEPSSELFVAEIVHGGGAESGVGVGDVGVGDGGYK